MDVKNIIYIYKKRDDNMSVISNRSCPCKLFFFFTPRRVLELAETHLKISLWSGRYPWENSYRLSQLGIRFLDNSFAGLVRKPLIQLKVSQTLVL